MPEITKQEFVAAMRAAVEERGADWIYPAIGDNLAIGERGDEWHNHLGACLYQKEDGTPACIVGLALHKIDPEVVPPHSSDVGAQVVLAALRLPSEVARAAHTAQAAQDQGRTWGEALKIFEMELESE